MAFPYATLSAAALDCYDALYPCWLNASSVTLGIKPTGVVFYTALAATFPQSSANGQPCANLIAIIAAQVTNLPTPAAANIPTLAQFNDLVVSIYKLLWLTNQLQVQGLITAAQGNAVLAAFNTAFSVG